MIKLITAILEDVSEKFYYILSKLMCVESYNITPEVMEKDPTIISSINRAIEEARKDKTGKYPLLEIIRTILIDNFTEEAVARLDLKFTTYAFNESKLRPIRICIKSKDLLNHGRDGLLIGYIDEIRYKRFLSDRFQQLEKEYTFVRYNHYLEPFNVALQRSQNGKDIYREIDYPTEEIQGRTRKVCPMLTIEKLVKIEYYPFLHQTATRDSRYYSDRKKYLREHILAKR